MHSILRRRHDSWAYHLFSRFLRSFLRSPSGIFSWDAFASRFAWMPLPAIILIETLPTEILPAEIRPTEIKHD